MVGSGAIGVEFASFYRTMGADVTIVEVLPQILPAEDLKELGATLPTGTSAYVALVDKQHAEEVAAMFLEEGATVVDLPIEADLSSAVRRAILRRVRSR